MLMIGFFCLSLMLGVRTALSNFMNIFYWELPGQDIGTRDIRRYPGRLLNRLFAYHTIALSIRQTAGDCHECRRSERYFGDARGFTTARYVSGEWLTVASVGYRGVSDVELSIREHSQHQRDVRTGRHR